MIVEISLELERPRYALCARRGARRRLSSCRSPLHAATLGPRVLCAEVRGEYTPGSPGRLLGPPEDCYPPEPAEASIVSSSHELTAEEEERAIGAILEEAELRASELVGVE